jgi:ABC-2 type transport system ATP-binding protein
MTEMALTADHVIVIGRDRLLGSGPMADFIEWSAGHHVKVVTPNADSLVTLLRDKGAVVTVDGPQDLSVQGLESRDVGILASGSAPGHVSVRLGSTALTITGDSASSAASVTVSA